MKKYIQPTIEEEYLINIDTYMLTASDEEGEIGGGNGAGDAKFREEELGEILSQQQDAWEDGLW